VDKIQQLNALFGQMKVVDLAPKLERGIPRWPSHPPLIIDQTMTHEHDGYYCQNISMGEHTGCHMDAPYHSLPQLAEATVDKVPLAQLLAPAILYDFTALNLAPGELLDASHFENYEKEKGVKVGAGHIALINFGWMKKHWRTDAKSQWYALNSPGMTEAATIMLSGREIKAVGTDTIACELAVVDGKLGGAYGHEKHFLPKGIVIVECVANLEELPLQSYFIAQPLKIAHGSGSPLRPIALF
jgi:kynurenine formamidase